MAKLYKCKPSEIVFIDDEYTAFCFNEACAYITIQIQENDMEPNFIQKYKSFKDIYKNL